MGIKITFPDGSKKEFKKGVKGIEIAEAIGKKLAKDALAISVNENIQDLSSSINEDSKIKILTFKDPEGIEVFRHSSAHLLAHAVRHLYPKALSTIGPVVEEGFYYDFDNLKITPEDFPKIEEEMKKIIRQNIAIRRVEYKTKAEARKDFKGNKYKLELIDEFEGKISSYKQGDFIDLCRGPHVPNTGVISAIKLTKLAGAYWRGDSKNKMLTRIYGISFPEGKELRNYLTLLEEAEKRDHRKIGRELDLFSFHEEAPGMAFFHPKGMIIWDELMRYWNEVHTKAGYKQVKTPIILNKSLWLRSGHWDHYKENMYFTNIDRDEYAVKPMNCPGGILIYKTSLHSYRELPLRLAEVGLVHRHELSGVLSGLFRVRSFHQDDAHIFCSEEQIEDEIMKMINLFAEVYAKFNLLFNVELSTKPAKAMGSEELWRGAENSLENALKKRKLSYKINPGDGAFYGPKIDFHIKDAIGRTWQCGTIQLDFQMPEKFDLSYEGADCQRHRPVMLHRVVYGSVERFIGILIEHYAGKFPLWLSPEQVRILPISDNHNKYAEQVAKEMFDAGIRVNVDSRSETISKKIREAQLAQINYILVVGDKEVKSNTINVRTRDNVIHGAKKINVFIKELNDEINSRK